MSGYGYSKLTYEDMVNSPDVYGASDYPKWAKELSDRGYKGVAAVDFYDDIFGSDLEQKGVYECGKYCGIAVERVPKKDGTCTGHRISVTQDMDNLIDMIDTSDNFCMMAPISYAGKARTNDNARMMYALCIEVDGIKERGGLNELIYSWEREYLPVPQPTYIVCSGSGLHLYYVFDVPIPLWRNVFESLSAYKKYLTPRLWTSYISDLSERIQYESINQPFRIVGTRTKNGGRTLAFKTGDKVTVDYMDKFVPDDIAMTAVYKSKHSLADAKKLYPDWYVRRIENGESRRFWTRYKPIYYNWINKIMTGAVVGKRYHCLENLCSLAVQCNIEPEQVEEDCRRVAARLELLTVDDNNHFTEYDVLCALKTYHNADITAFLRNIDIISNKTGIRLVRNKRNGRKQQEHLKIARFVQSIQDVDWRNKDGAPTKQEIVQAWRAEHSDGRKIDCERDTGLSRHTILKWWDSKENKKNEKRENN